MTFSSRVKMHFSLFTFCFLQSSYLITWHLCFGFAEDFVNESGLHATEGFRVLV